MSDFSTQTTYSFDFDQVNEGLKVLTEATVKQARAGMREAGNQLLLDAVEIDPRAPHLNGMLRASAKSEGGIGNDSITVGFDVPYARRWHEAEGDIDPVTGAKITWSEQGVGPKFLEKKLVDNSDKYLQIMAAKVAEVVGA